MCMIIEYPNTHSWFKPVKADSFSHYGNSDRKRLIKTLAAAKSFDIRTVIEPANDAFFAWFLPLYTNTIKTKKNGQVWDVYSKTMGNPKHTYYTLTVYEKDAPIGGCIFSDREKHHSIAYRMYEREWHFADGLANPALYGEFILDEYSFSKNKERLVHGQDRNPYGINSAIGLAMFKLSVGCSVKLAPIYEKLSLETTETDTDILVLHYPTTGNLISEATLCTTNDNLSKYTQLFKYSDRLTIHTELRNSL